MDKVLVRDGNHYAVLWAWEFAALAGIHLRKHASDDVRAILLRYGVALDDSPASTSENSSS